MRLPRLPDGWSLRTIALIFGVALGIGLLMYFFNWYALIGMGVLVVALGLFSLFVSKTAAGKKVGERIGTWLFKRKFGQRLVRSQMHAAARKQGVPLRDATGRKRSDVELQLDLYETPETQMIKQQLRGMNPVQRAQFLRMLEAQSDAQRRGEALPPATGGSAAAARPIGPRPSGRPVTGPPRSSRSPKRRKK